MAQNLRAHLLNASRRSTFVKAGLGEWVGFTSSLALARAWASAGFTPQEAVEWRNGFMRPMDETDPGVAQVWRDRGFTPELALRQVRKKYPAPMRTR